MTRNISLVGIPAAVAGDPKKRTGIILATNYEARAFITSASEEEI